MWLFDLLPPPWPRGGVFLLGFALFFLLGLVVFSTGGAGGLTVQPIRFSHARHIGSGMSCPDCHTGAETQERATLPALAACLVCHESALTKSAEEEKIRTLKAAGKELAWTQLTRVPPHVYFSHRRHAQGAGLKCVACHGAMEKLTEPPRGPFRLWTMDTCTGCHQQEHAGNDCNDCHR